MSIYDELPKGNYISWDSVGDEIVGDVVAVAKGQDFNGNPCPELLILCDDGVERTLTAGQANLRAQLLEKRPETGDRVKITFESEEKRQRGSLKKFVVKVTKGGAKNATKLEEDF